MKKKLKPPSIEDYRRAKFGPGARDPFDATAAAKAEESDGRDGPGRPSVGVAKDCARFMRDTGISVLFNADAFWTYGAANDPPWYIKKSSRELQGIIEAWQSRATGDIHPSLARKMVDALLAAYRAGIPAPPVWLRPDKSGRYPSAKGALVTANGILDVDEAVRKPTSRKAFVRHSPDLFATGGVPYIYAPRARCPKFERYVETTFAEDEERQVFQKTFGWVLLPDRSLPAFMVFYGHKGTGKGVAVNTLRALVGRGNCCNIPMHRLGDRFLVGDLARCKANIVGESPQRSMVAPDKERPAVEGTLKEISGGYGSRIADEEKFVSVRGRTAETVSAANVFTFNPPFPVFLDAALYDRANALRFDRRFRFAGDEDKTLAEDIERDEMAGVLGWSLEGARMLRADLAAGVPRPLECPSGAALIRASRCGSSESSVSLFLEEECLLARGGFVPSAELWARWKEWSSALDDAGDADVENPASPAKSPWQGVTDASLPRIVRRLWPECTSDRNGQVRGIRGLVLKRQNARTETPDPAAP